MLTTAALLLTLSAAPARADGLALTNVRLTQGVLGPPREDAKFLPGDSCFVAFEMENVAADDEGRVRYSTAVEVLDAANKVIFKQPAKDRSAVNSLGGNRLPAFAQVDAGLDSPPGDYTLKVIVTDLTTKSSQTLTQKLSVLPRGFGLVRLNVTADPEGQLPPALLGVGQSVFLNAVAVDFGRDATKGQPSLKVELRVLDDKGKPVSSKPIVGVVEKDVPAKAVSVPVQFLLSLNRPGKFTLELKATDQTSRKPAIVVTYPLTVLER
jgi:hypothetical protein